MVESQQKICSDEEHNLISRRHFVSFPRSQVSLRVEVGERFRRAWYEHSGLNLKN